MRRTALSCLMVSWLLTGCGGQTDAQKTASALSGADRIAADKNPQCKLFTPAELARYVGTALAAGTDAAMGTGCQWVALPGGTGSAMIQVVPARYHEPHSGAKGFRQVPDVGTRGFVEQEMGGWNAGAITGPDAVVVSVDGAAATDATAIALLKETITRRAK